MKAAPNFQSSLQIHMVSDYRNPMHIHIYLGWFWDRPSVMDSWIVIFVIEPMLMSFFATACFFHYISPSSSFEW
jgi:hypothetical protein